MNAQLSLPVGPDSSAHRRQVSRDLAVVVAVTVAMFLISSAVELREWLTELTRPLEHYQLDELPLTFAALALSLAWFAWRRWQQSERELRLRVAAQRALGERESHYRTLFMENLAGNTLAASDGAMLLCNPAMAQILGLRSPEDAVARNLGAFYADPSLWAQHREALARGEKLEIPSLELRSAEGRGVKVIARMLARHSPEKSAELQVYLADITELQLIQKELAEILTENRLLSQSYLLVQEEERRNLAREMHDELGQCLNAVKLDAVLICELSKGTQPEIERSAASIVEISNHVYEVVRSMMQRLRPAALDALGLRDAVGDLVDQWRRRNPSVICGFEADGDLSGLGELTNITVYRLVQECLTNVAKHSGAAHVYVGVARTGATEVRVTVRDNGRGMDLHAKRLGLGLVGLRERVEALQGRLELTGTPGEGVHVTAWLPLMGRG
jgi:PAS domain S-box-containing protein